MAEEKPILVILSVGHIARWKLNSQRMVMHTPRNNSPTVEHSKSSKTPPRENMPKRIKPLEKQSHRSESDRKVPVVFSLEQPDAQEVFLSGDFNEWSTRAERMIRHNGDGHWEKRLMLPPGRYEYQFLVDGKWTPDPTCQANVKNSFGSINSVVEI